LLKKYLNYGEVRFGYVYTALKEWREEERKERGDEVNEIITTS
jgi:hypothetical protein